MLMPENPVWRYTVQRIEAYLYKVEYPDDDLAEKVHLARVGMFVPSEQFCGTSSQTSALLTPGNTKRLLFKGKLSYSYGAPENNL